MRLGLPVGRRTPSPASSADVNVFTPSVYDRGFLGTMYTFPVLCSFRPLETSPRHRRHLRKKSRYETS